MKKFSFIQDLNIGPQESSRISQFLKQVEQGSDHTLRSPIGSSLDADQILSGWDSIFNAKVSQLNEPLLMLEESNRSKFGPRSIASPWVDRSSGVYEYFKSEKCSQFKSDAYYASQHQRLRPLNLDRAVLYLKNNTNSGLPFVTRKSYCKEKVLEDFSGLLERKDPCILFTRTQELGKTRTVWGYPIADTLNEMRFYRPLLEYHRTLPWRTSLLDPEAVDKSINDIITRAISSKSSIVSIDFNSYDTSVKIRLQERAFAYIKSLFQSSFEDDLNYILYRFNNIGLITPNGILNGPHGVPSGSTFTNEVDSIVQYQCAKDFLLNDDDMNIQGDDGVYITKEPSKIFSHFESYGLLPNKSKSYISSDYAVYLQNLYSKDYTSNGIIRGIYPTYRALGRLIFPERYDQYSVDGIKGADYNSIRAITILENCRYHPLFEDLVIYVLSLDKYGLEFSQQGLIKYINRVNETQGVEGIFNYRRGDSIKGIQSFETFKLIQALKSKHP